MIKPSKSVTPKSSFLSALTTISPNFRRLPAKTSCIENSTIQIQSSPIYLEEFFARNNCGMALANGWQVRMELVRKWGHKKGFYHLPQTAIELDDEDPVVTVTLARLRVKGALRFIRWSKPEVQPRKLSPGDSVGGSVQALDREGWHRGEDGYPLTSTCPRATHATQKVITSSGNQI